MKFIVFVILFLLVACGKKKDDKVSVQAIEEEFAAAGKSYGVSFTRSTESISIVSKSAMDTITSSDNSNVAGFCLCPTTGKVCKIYLRQDIWDSANDKSRRQLVFHELGHCNLSREHNSNALNIGNGTSSSCIFPISIMYPQMFSTSCKYNSTSPIDFASNHWGDYLSQLFSGSNSQLQRFGSVYTPGNGSSGGGRPAILINKLSQKPTETNPPFEKDENNDEFINQIYAYKIKKIDDCTYIYSDPYEDEENETVNSSK